MQTPSAVPAGGFYLENGLPDEYYAFTGGEVSLTVERHGGVNTITVLDILRHDGKLYPDMCPTPPIICKEGGRCGKRELYGPGIQFLSTNRQPEGRPGRNLFHVPDRLELYPFGFLSESERFGHRTRYDACIDGRTILFRFANAFPTRDRFVMTLNKDHIRAGEMVSQKDKVNEWSAQYGLTAPPRPFPDDYRMTLTWDFIGAAAGGLVMDGRMKFAYGEKRVVVLFAASRPLEVQELKTRYTVSCPWDKAAGSDEIRLCVAVAESREAAARLAAEQNRRGDEIFAQRIADNVAYALGAPTLEVASAPPAAEYGRVFPAFARAMLLAENGGELCIRAAAIKYGFAAIWDHIYPVKAFLIMGDYETARKLLRYMLSFPPIAAMVHPLIQTIIQTEEVVTCTGDRQFLQEQYAALKRFFAFLVPLADPAMGLIAYVNGFGVDDPSEAGVAPGARAWFPCVNGWWYNACRAMENLALLTGDRATVATARAVAAKLDAHYLDVFYDPAKGYLRSVVDPKTRRGAGVYQNVATIALDYPYGEYLFHRRLREIAAYQAYALYHPAGRSAVAYDDNAHEMWKNVIMCQHLAHEAKLARAAGLGDEALRITNNYLDLFARCKVGIETHNLVGCVGDISQRADWYAISARAGYGAIVEGVIGIQWDLGGFHYVPAAVPGPMRLDGFPFRRTRWDITISGEGAYVSQMRIDGRPLPGTLRLPAPLLDGEGVHSLEIIRSREPFARPTLLAAVGAGVTEIQSGPRELSFGVTEPARTLIKLASPAPPTVRRAGENVTVEWHAETGIAWCDVPMAPGQRFVATTAPQPRNI